MDEVARLIPVVLRRHVRCSQPPVVEILAPLWARVAGKAIAAECRPIAFAAGKLTLATGSLAWAAQLRALREELRAGINSFLGGPVVRAIVIRQSPERACAGGAPAAAATTSPQEPRGNRVASRAPGDEYLPAPGVNLPPDIAAVVAESFARYFARPRGTPWR